LAVLSASLALAEDFKTVNGKEYKDVTVTRVEADGIVFRTKTGISKVYFVELPKDVQERFHYSAANAIAAQRQREPIKVEVTQDGVRHADGGGKVVVVGQTSGRREADRNGWVGALPVSALFLRLLAMGALIITGVVLAVVRSRF
jgi:hypothetical protein